MHTSEQILQDDIDKLQLERRTSKECIDVAAAKTASALCKMREVASIMRYVADSQPAYILEALSPDERVSCLHRSFGAAFNALYASDNIKLAYVLIEAVQNTYEEASASKENEQG
jgi:hypothetical protein